MSWYLLRPSRMMWRNQFVSLISRDLFRKVLRKLVLKCPKISNSSLHNESFYELFSIVNDGNILGNPIYAFSLKQLLSKQVIKWRYLPPSVPLFDLNYKAAATGATKQKGNGVWSKNQTASKPPTPLGCREAKNAHRGYRVMNLLVAVYSHDNLHFPKDASLKLAWYMGDLS